MANMRLKFTRKLTKFELLPHSEWPPGCEACQLSGLADPAVRDLEKRSGLRVELGRHTPGTCAGPVGGVRADGLVSEES